MKLAYLGTPEMSVPPLQALVEAGHDVELVVTGVDKRRGRGAATSPSPVKLAATELGVRVVHDVDEVVESARSGDVELGVVVAFGRIIRPHVLAAVPMVNLHFSLLPRWRGAAPVERAILAGDERTGVCLMRVEEGLDTGGVYDCSEVPIAPDTTAAELRSTLVDVGGELLVRTLAQPLSSWIDSARPQHGEVTYADKLSSAELEIDWSTPAEQQQRIVRVGGAWTTFRGRRLKIHAAEIRDDRLAPTVVQPEGRQPMPFADWRNGARPGPDELFGDR